MRRIFTFVAASAFLCAMAHAQDTQSLGDIARQARLQKQQKEGQGKQPGAKPPSASDVQNKDSEPSGQKAVVPASARVITNEEIPEQTASTDAAAHPSHSTPELTANAGNKEAQGEQWKSQIQAQKSQIASLQQEITSLGNSIHYAGGNCVANCVQWNERQQQKQQQLDSMKAQLEEQQHHLEEMQDAARKQGFGSSVYDP
jgi:chromosome segregation ATPase